MESTTIYPSVFQAFGAILFAFERIRAPATVVGSERSDGLLQTVSIHPSRESLSVHIPIMYLFTSPERIRLDKTNKQTGNTPVISRDDFERIHTRTRHSGGAAVSGVEAIIPDKCVLICPYVRVGKCVKTAHFACEVNRRCRVSSVTRLPRVGNNARYCCRLGACSSHLREVWTSDRTTCERPNSHVWYSTQCREKKHTKKKQGEKNKHD